jgi:hypothetical protein
MLRLTGRHGRRVLAHPEKRRRAHPSSRAMPAPARRFEFFDDNHWNGLGHGVAAEAVLESKLLARLKQ